MFIKKYIVKVKYNRKFYWKENERTIATCNCMNNIR